MADVVLRLSEDFLFTPYVFGPDSSIPRDWWVREFISLYVFMCVGAAIMYLSLAGLNYAFIFDKKVLQHPKLLPNQVFREIYFTLEGVPVVGFLTTAVFFLELKGYSRIYETVDEFGWGYLVFSIVLFLFFTDCLIYFIHRGLHESKTLYRWVHKPHHQWIVTTPFASHAFHPVDGFLQSVPYHLFVFVFPFHKYVYLLMFVLVNVWTVSIHDGDYRVPEALDAIVNGAQHHTYHHLFFRVNYGQYFTLWDRLFGTHKVDEAELKREEDRLKQE